MIPVPTFSATFYLLLSIGFFTLIGLAVWVGALVLLPAARGTLRRHPGKCLVAMAALALPSAFFGMGAYTFWRVQQDAEQDRQARQLTLAHAQEVGLIAMPAGTRLSTRRPHDPASFEEAVFPTPSLVFGLQASRVTRILRSDPDGQAPHPIAAHVTLASDQVVSGWRCGTTGTANFKFELPGGPPVFTACRLGPGNHIGPWQVPAGASLSATPGTLYLDGTREQDRWLVDLEENVSPPMQLMGASLKNARIHVDAQGRFVRLADGQLAQELSWGSIRHPAGTRMQTAGVALQKRYPGAVLFSPIPGQVVKHPGQDDLRFGSTMLQTPDGAVLAVLPNAEAGVFEFFRIETD